MQSGSDYWFVNGLKLYVHRFVDPKAAPSGQTILILHGIFDAGSTWELVAEPLCGAGHEVLAPDLRGFGKSDWLSPGGYYHFPDYVADVGALVDELNPKRLSLIGHSMGGTIASLYTAASGGRVERLSLLEGLGPPAMPKEAAPDRMTAWLRDLRRIERVPRPLSSMDDAVYRLAAVNPRVPHERLMTRAPLLTRLNKNGQLVWAYDPLHKTTSPSSFRVEEFQGFLKRITCPVLYVGGGSSGWHVEDEAERLAMLRDVKHVELEDAGHMMHWTEPQKLAGLLIDFFGERA